MLLGSTIGILEHETDVTFRKCDVTTFVVFKTCLFLVNFIPLTMLYHTVLRQVQEDEESGKAALQFKERIKLRGAMLKRKIWISALFFLATTEAFVVVHHQQHPSSPLQRRRQQQQPTKLSCICIDCARVTNCAAYHFVETKHEQPHMNENPTFEPVNGRCVHA